MVSFEFCRHLATLSGSLNIHNVASRWVSRLETVHLPLKVGGNVIKVAIWPFQRCVYTRVVALYPIWLVSLCLVMPWYATSGSPDEAWTPGWHIFRLKMWVSWVRLHRLHTRSDRCSLWLGKAGDNRLSGPVWPLIWRDGFSTNNNRLLAHI